MMLSVMRAAVLVGAISAMMSVPADAQMLKQATVQLHTNDDDRPANSILEFSVLTNRDALLFNDRAPAEAYQPNSDHTLTLKVPPGLDKKQFVKSFAMVHFEPKGRDALKFDFTLELVFSDNSKVVSSWTKLFLDQDHRDFTGAIYLP
jgi:hypothetical protein